MPKPQYEPKTIEQAVGYVVEECGELCAALGKTIRWGWHSANPELPENEQVKNKDWVRAEMRDVEEAIFRLRKFMDDQ